MSHWQGPYWQSLTTLHTTPNSISISIVQGSECKFLKERTTHLSQTTELIEWGEWIFKNVFSCHYQDFYSLQCTFELASKFHHYKYKVPHGILEIYVVNSLPSVLPASSWKFTNISVLTFFFFNLFFPCPPLSADILCTLKQYFLLLKYILS